MSEDCGGKKEDYPEDACPECDGVTHVQNTLVCGHPGCSVREESMGCVTCQLDLKAKEEEAKKDKDEELIIKMMMDAKSKSVKECLLGCKRKREQEKKCKVKRHKLTE